MLTNKEKDKVIGLVKTWNETLDETANYLGIDSPEYNYYLSRVAGGIEILKALKIYDYYLETLVRGRG